MAVVTNQNPLAMKMIEGSWQFEFTFNRDVLEASNTFNESVKNDFAYSESYVSVGKLINKQFELRKMLDEAKDNNKKGKSKCRY